MLLIKVARWVLAIVRFLALNPVSAAIQLPIGILLLHSWVLRLLPYNLIIAGHNVFLPYRALLLWASVLVLVMMGTSYWAFVITSRHVNLWSTEPLRNSSFGRWLLQMVKHLFPSCS